MSEQNKSEQPPASAPAVASGELLAEFGKIMLGEIMQGEWEPDFDWQQTMLEKAEAMGLIRTRPVEEGDDAPEGCDFVYETTFSANNALSEEASNKQNP